MARVITDRKAAKLQDYFRGFSNKHRIKMLLELQRQPDLSVQDFADILSINFRTASEHTKKLKNAGLISKKYFNREVVHNLTPLGKYTVKLIKNAKNRL